MHSTLFLNVHDNKNAYEKALELDPTNQMALQAIAQLKKKNRFFSKLDPILDRLFGIE